MRTAHFCSFYSFCHPFYRSRVFELLVPTFCGQATAERFKFTFGCFFFAHCDKIICYLTIIEARDDGKWQLLRWIKYELLWPKNPEISAKQYVRMHVQYRITYIAPYTNAVKHSRYSEPIFSKQRLSLAAPVEISRQDLPISSRSSAYTTFPDACIARHLHLYLRSAWKFVPLGGVQRVVFSCAFYPVLWSDR